MEGVKSYDFPNEEIRFQLIVEEMKQLIPFLKEEMKACPTQDLVFTLIETVDFYTLKRFFKLKSNVSSNSKSLSQFKETLLANISNLDSFIAIPHKNSFALDSSNNKGNQFQSPKVYNTEGDESIIDFGSGESVLFLYDNTNDLNLFLEKNQNIKIACFCLGVNLNFFEQKKNLKTHGYLNKNNLYFYFTEFETNKSNSNKSLKLTSLPRVLFVDSDNIVREDRFIKNIHNFDIERDLINYYESKSNKNEEHRKIDSNFVLLENENKRKIIKAMNIYLKECGLDDVHFYVKSKISIDKKGIKKTRCYPVFYGDSDKVGKELVDNLIKELNGQELFHDFQNKVNA